MAGSRGFNVNPDPAENLKSAKDYIKMPGKSQSDVATGFIGINRKHPDYYALQVGNTVMGRMGLGGRVGQKVRDKEGMAYYAHTFFDAGIDAGPYIFRAGVNPGNVDKAIEYALGEMKNVVAKGITQQEMEDAIVYMAGGLARQVETNSGMAGVILQQDLFELGDDFYLRYSEILQNLTLDDVNKALAKHVQTENYCLVVAGPEK